MCVYVCVYKYIYIYIIEVGKCHFSVYSYYGYKLTCTSDSITSVPWSTLALVTSKCWGTIGMAMAVVHTGFTIV